jgi:hypothetical protein
VLPEPYVFSTGYKSVQGGQKWYYEYKTGNAYTPMTWGLHPTIPTAEVWRGNERYLLISRGSMHPGDNSDAVLKWVAPYAGSVSVTGKAYDGDTTCGDGASAQVLINGTSLWQETITDATGKSHSLTQTVAEGDALYFIVKKGGNSSCDTTKWDPTITYTSISE